MKKATIFSHFDKGTDYKIILNKNTGFNEDYFENIDNFKAGNSDYNLIHSREYTNFDNILKQLSIYK